MVNPSLQEYHVAFHAVIRRSQDCIHDFGEVPGAIGGNHRIRDHPICLEQLPVPRFNPRRKLPLCGRERGLVRNGVHLRKKFLQQRHDLAKPCGN